MSAKLIKRMRALGKISYFKVTKQSNIQDIIDPRLIC